MRQEYKIAESRKRKAEDLMNEMAAQGREVVSVNCRNGWKLTLMIPFSREKA